MINFNIVLAILIYTLVFAMLFSVCTANKFNRAQNLGFNAISGNSVIDDTLKWYNNMDVYLLFIIEQILIYIIGN